MTEQDAMPSETRTVEQGPGEGYNSFHLHLSNSPADTAIRPQVWCGRRGRPVVSFFLPPPMRGGGAPRAPCHGFRRGGPGVTGRPRARGLTHPCADASASPWRATRHRSAFAFTAAGPGRGLTPAGLPGGRPLYVAWRQRSEPRTRVPHPAPPFERLAK